MMVWKMFLLFRGCILRFHVNLPTIHFQGGRVSFRELTPWQINPAMENEPFEDVFRIENRDIPLLC